MAASQLLTDQIAQAATNAEQLSNELTLSLNNLQATGHAGWNFAGLALPQTQRRVNQLRRAIENVDYAILQLTNHNTYMIGLGHRANISVA
jgi:hypothetical protein